MRGGKRAGRTADRVQPRPHGHSPVRGDLARPGAGRHVPALPGLPAPDQLDEAGRAVRARHARVRVVRPQQPRRRRARASGARAGVHGPRVRRPGPRRDGGRARRVRHARRRSRSLRLRVAVDAARRRRASCSGRRTASTAAGSACLRSASPSRGSLRSPGSRRRRTTWPRTHPSAIRARASSSSASGTRGSSSHRVSCPGRDASCSARRARCDTAMLAFSPLSIRYLSPYTEHVRGGTGSYVVDAAIERVERHADGYRIHASGTTWEGELELESRRGDRGDGLPCARTRPAERGRGDGQRRPDAGADPVLGECLGPRDLLRRQCDAGFARPAQAWCDEQLRHRSTASATTPAFSRSTSRRSTSVSARERRSLDARRGRSASCWRARARARALDQKGYLARVVGVDEAEGIRDQGIVPLAHFVDRDGGDACAVAVEYDADGTVIPVVYIRRGGRLAEHSLPRHPLHRFDTDEHRQCSRPAWRRSCPRRTEHLAARVATSWASCPA